MKNPFIGCFNRSVIVTYLGLACSLLGISLLLTQNVYESVNRMDIAMIFLIIAGICDLFDGFIARKCKRNDIQKQFGIQIDSLVDVISFLVFPAVILLKMNTSMWWLASLYMIAGVTRLAWVNIHTDGHTDYYQGLPVTFIAFFAPIIYSLNIGFNNIVFPILYSIISLLFVLNIPIKKPKSILAYALFSIVAIGVVLLILC